MSVPAIEEQPVTTDKPSHVPQSREYSVLLVDDDAHVRSWLRLALDSSEFRVAGEAASAAEAIDLAQRRKPDLVLVDYRLPDVRGTELVTSLNRLDLAMMTVIMTANAERGLNEASREAGAQGSMLKSAKGQELIETLRRVVAGEKVFDPRHPQRTPGRRPLSPRERETLRLVARGLTNREIASELDVGEETVKTVLSRACSKLGIHRRVEAVSEAHKLGLL